MAKTAPRQLILFLLVITMGELVAMPSARADMYFPLVRITCVPQARYAAIETIGIYNAHPDARAALAAQGFRELAAVAQEPVTCALPQGTLRIEVIDYHPPQLEGMCSQVEDGNLRVSLSGKEIAFAKGTHGGCTGFQRHDIRVTEYGVQHCILRLTHEEVVGPTDFRPIDAECNNAWFSQ